MGKKGNERPFTIMPTESNHCYLCGRFVSKYEGHWHHCIHGRANRGIADKEGLIVRLCKECHTEGKGAVHRNPNMGNDLWLMKEAQDVWETKYIIDHDCEREEAREAFRQLFGKSYIYD